MKKRTEPLAFWKEEDRKGNDVEETVTLILDSPGCYWSEKIGCSMCGYNYNISRGQVSHEEYMSQLDKRIEDIRSIKYVKIFTSGSFFDTKEIPEKTMLEMIARIHDISPSSRILVESRPEFVNRSVLGDIKRIHEDLEVAIGLETVDDGIRSKLIRKGFTYKEFIGAAKLLKENDIALKSYLLMKPPFLDERSSISDMKNSINKLMKDLPEQTISINPMNIQKGTVVERLFQRGLYRPPWIWSLIEVFMEFEKKIDNSIKLMSSPTAGGRLRGAHNCGKCDPIALNSIKEFSLSQDFSDLVPPLDCCSRDWERYTKTEIAGT